jgi:hypothetical protein
MKWPQHPPLALAAKDRMPALDRTGDDAEVQNEKEADTRRMPEELHGAEGPRVKVPGRASGSSGKSIGETFLNQLVVALCCMESTAHVAKGQQPVRRPA